MKKMRAILVASLLFGFVCAANAESSPTAVLDKYCVGCHNQRQKVAGLMLDGLDADRGGLALIDGGKLPAESVIVDAAAALLQSGDINAANTNGDTAVHAAAAMGYDSVIKLLAEKGANLNIRNSRGDTPLGALMGRNRQASRISPTIELLRKLGAVE